MKNRIKVERVVLALFLTAFIVRVASMYYTYLSYKTNETNASTARQEHLIIDGLYQVQYEASEVENTSDKYMLLAPGNYRDDSNAAYYAGLANRYVEKLNKNMQGLLDSVKKDQPNQQSINELGKMVSDMEKTIAPILSASQAGMEHLPIHENKASLETQINNIISKSNEIIAQHTQLFYGGRSQVIAGRRRTLDETYFAGVVGLIFVCIVLLFLNRDIVRRKKAEAKTRENEQKLRKMIEEVGDVIYSADYTGKFTFINARLESLTGYRHDELLGKEYAILVHPDSLKKVTEYYGVQFKNRIPETSYEFPIITKHGKTKWVEQNVVLITSGDMVEGFQCVVRDISRRKDAEASMKAALEKEKQINEMKSRFVSLASHEFRTPLGTILSSTELIREYMEYESQSPAFIKDKKIHHLNRIKSSIQNMVTTLNNFLSLDQLEQGKAITNPTEFDVKKLSEEMVEKLSGKLKEGQKVEYVHSSEASHVSMDRNILSNVILNLLTNAIKYSPENSIISYSTNVTANGLEFMVEDHGIGIPESEQSNLFERFFRAKNTFNIEGTGLGLSIVKKYIDLLNGHISFISHENQGSVFKVFISNAEIPPDSAYADEKMAANSRK